VLVNERSYKPLAEEVQSSKFKVVLTRNLELGTWNPELPGRVKKDEVIDTA